MSKEDYLQMKKQARVWFTVNIVISLMAIAGGILVVISKSRHIPFLLMALGALTLIEPSLGLPLLSMPKKKLRKNIQNGRACLLKILNFLWRICRKGFWYQLRLF